MMQNRTVADFYDYEEFEELLERADFSAIGEWEMNFVADMIDKFEQYGLNTYISDKQQEMLEKLANN